MVRKNTLRTIPKGHSIYVKMGNYRCCSVEPKHCVGKVDSYFDDNYSTSFRIYHSNGKTHPMFGGPTWYHRITCIDYMYMHVYGEFYIESVHAEWIL